MEKNTTIVPRCEGLVNSAVDKEIHDNYIGAEVLLNHEGERKQATVKQRKLDSSGKPIGVANDNYMMDTRVYVVEFDDGKEEERLVLHHCMMVGRL